MTFQPGIGTLNHPAFARLALPGNQPHLPETLSKMVFSIDIRVRYQETDAQGRLHHANYINYFEVARVELLRAGGFSYRKLEESGVMLVVAEVGCQYHLAARYDDLLTVETTIAWTRGVRIRHDYRVFRTNEGATARELMAQGYTIVAAVNPEGKVIRLPKWLREFKLAEVPRRDGLNPEQDSSDRPVP